MAYVPLRGRRRKGCGCRGRPSLAEGHHGRLLLLLLVVARADAIADDDGTAARVDDLRREEVLDPGRRVRVLEQYLRRASGGCDRRDRPALVVRGLQVDQDVAALHAQRLHGAFGGGRRLPLGLAGVQVEGEDLVGAAGAAGVVLGHHVEGVGVGGDAAAAFELRPEDGEVVPAVDGGVVPLVTDQLGPERPVLPEREDAPLLLLALGQRDDEGVHRVDLRDLPAALGLVGPLGLAGDRVDLLDLVLGLVHVVGAAVGRGDELGTAGEGERLAVARRITEQFLAVADPVAVGVARTADGHGVTADRQTDVGQQVPGAVLLDRLLPAGLAGVEVDHLQVGAVGLVGGAVHHADDDLAVGRGVTGRRAHVGGQRQAPLLLAVGRRVAVDRPVHALDDRVADDPRAVHVLAVAGQVDVVLRQPEDLGLTVLAPGVEVVVRLTAVALAVALVDLGRLARAHGFTAGLGDGVLALVVTAARDEEDAPADDEERGERRPDDDGGLALEGAAAGAAGRRSAGVLLLRVAVTGLLRVRTGLLAVGPGLLRVRARRGAVRTGLLGVRAGDRLAGGLGVAVAGLRAGCLRVAVARLRRGRLRSTGGR